MPIMAVKVKHIWSCQKRSLDYALGGLPDGRIYPLTGTRRPEKGLPDNKITRYFSKTPKAARAVQICELCRTHRRQGKITRTPKKPQHGKTPSYKCRNEGSLPGFQVSRISRKLEVHHPRPPATATSHELEAREKARAPCDPWMRGWAVRQWRSRGAWMPPRPLRPVRRRIPRPVGQLRSRSGRRHHDSWSWLHRVQQHLSFVIILFSVNFRDAKQSCGPGRLHERHRCALGISRR